jgi:HicA toxin of bacterial toxin-antitoxin,
VSQLEKLIADLRNNPRDVRFDDACRIAEAIGFVYKGGKGSHRAFARPGEPVQLNFQNRQGRIPPYQARQLLTMVEKYHAD